MAKTLSDYKGSVVLIAGITTSGSGGYALVEAHDIQVETGTGAESRLDGKLSGIQTRLGTADDTANATGTSVWSRVKKLQNDVGSVSGDSLATRLTAAEGDIDNLQSDLGTKPNGHAAAFSSITTLESGLGKSTDSSSSSGTAAWPRIKNAETDIDNLQAGLGTSSATASASGTSAWSRIKNAESDIDSLESTTAGHTSAIGTDSTSGTIKGRIKAIENQIGDGTTGNSITARIGALETEVGTTGSSSTSLSVRVGNLETENATQGSNITALQNALGTSSSAAASNGTSAWSRIKNAETDIDNLESTTSTQGSSITTLQNGLGTSGDTASSTGTTAWSRVKNAETDIDNLESTTSSQGSSITTLQNGLGTSGDTAAANGTTAWSRVKNAETDIDNIQTAIGTSGDTASASGNVIWPRLKRAESDIDDLEAGLGKSTNTAAANGTTAWSRVKNAESDITTLKSDVSTNATNITTLDNNLGKSTDAASTASSASAWARIKALEGATVPNVGITIAASASDISDTSKTYLYTGTTTTSAPIRTKDHIYYYNGSAWVDGGAIGGISLDTTLQSTGAAPQSKVVGDAINDIKDNLVAISSTQPSSNTNRIWINSSATQVQIPTMTDFATHQSEVGGTIQEIRDDIDDFMTEANGNISDIASDVTTLDSTVSQLSSDLDGKFVKYTDYTITENEYVDKNNGSVISYNAWDRTNFIEVDNTKTLYIYNGGSKTAYCGQYENSNASSFLRSFTIESGWNKIMLDPLCTRIVMSAARRNNTVNLLKIRNDLFVKNKAVTDGIFQIPNFINVKWITGTLDDNGNVIYYTKRLVSEYIELPRKNMELHISIDNWHTCIYEYDSTKTHVYHPNGYKASNYKIITSPETKYIRVICFDGRDSSKDLYPDDIYTSNILMTTTPIVEKLKVMTYNVGHYDYGTGMGLPSNIYDEKLKNYRRFLGNQNVDVIGIQEYDSWMNYADTEEDAIFANDVLWDHFYPYRVDTGSWGSIKSKEFAYWTYKEQLSTGRWYVRAYINGILLISVHLSVGTSNTQTRITEANEIVSILQNEERFIMFGDFNCEPGEEDALYSVFTSQNYKIANRGFFGDYYTWSSARTDFSHYDNPTGQLYYIDNIIVSDNINIVDVYPIPEAYDICTSDHIPFVAELEIS